MIQISHEVPLQLLNESVFFNDYDYALVHLFERYPEYLNFFKNSLSSGRIVILDNSLYELGKPFAWDNFYTWLLSLKPSYAIIPDLFDNFEFTYQSVIKYSQLIRDIGIKTIGVLQGSTLDELCLCYSRIEPYVDVVAISFGYPAYKRHFKDYDVSHSMLYGRIVLINMLIQRNLINYTKHHHLLGCALPQEMLFYRQPNYHFLKTIDTSSPVTSGLMGNTYEAFGLLWKPTLKLMDFFDRSLYAEQLDLIYTNISKFRQITCGV